MSWTFNLTNASFVDQAVSIDSSNKDFFHQKTFNQIAQWASENELPGLLFAVVERGSGNSSYSFYEGTSFCRWQVLAKQKYANLDPLTKQPIERIHYCMASNLRPNGGEISFSELDLAPEDLQKQLGAVVMALDLQNPHVDSAIKVISASLVLDQLCRYQLLHADQEGTLVEAVKSWQGFCKRLSKVQAPSKVWTQARQDKVEGVLETASNFLACPKKKKKRLSKTEVKETCEILMKVLRNDQAGATGLTASTLSDELGKGKNLLLAALQMLESKGQVRRKKTEGKTFYLACDSRSVQEATNALPVEDQTELMIKNSLEWQAGVAFGKIRKGHPEGAVIFHIEEIFRNIDQWYAKDDFLRSPLRLLAMVHDSFKHQVRSGEAKRGDNHHGYFAKQFLADFDVVDEEFLEIVRRHDDAYYLWLSAKSGIRSWEEATEKVESLLEDFPNRHSLYRAFFECDCKTGDKTTAPFDWFDQVYQEWVDKGGRV